MGQGKTMDNKFWLYVKTLTSLKWGPGRGGGGGGFNIQTGPILVHMWPSSFIIILSMISNPRSNLKEPVFMKKIKLRGPLTVKCLNQNVSQWSLCRKTRFKNLKTIFSFMGQNVKKMYRGYFGGPEGVFNDQTKPILFPAIHYPYLCTCEISNLIRHKFKPKICNTFIFGGS